MSLLFAYDIRVVFTLRIILFSPPLANTHHASKRLACWVKKSDDDNILKYISYFSPENLLWHFMQSVSLGDNLHETLKPIF